MLGCRGRSSCTCRATAGRCAAVATEVAPTERGCGGGSGRDVFGRSYLASHAAGTCAALPSCGSDFSREAHASARVGVAPSCTCRATAGHCAAVATEVAPTERGCGGGSGRDVFGRSYLASHAAGTCAALPSCGSDFSREAHASAWVSGSVPRVPAAPPQAAARPSRLKSLPQSEAAGAGVDATFRTLRTAQAMRLALAQRGPTCGSDFSREAHASARVGVDPSCTGRATAGRCAAVATEVAPTERGCGGGSGRDVLGRGVPGGPCGGRLRSADPLVGATSVARRTPVRVSGGVRQSLRAGPGPR